VPSCEIEIFGKTCYEYEDDLWAREKHRDERMHEDKCSPFEWMQRKAMLKLADLHHKGMYTGSFHPAKIQAEV
jgi:hypothetical protein